MTTKPFSEASLKALTKSNGCSLSNDVVKFLLVELPTLIDKVPYKKRFKAIDGEQQKKVICVKKWFDLQLGQKNYLRKDRLTVCHNMEVLLTHVLMLACKNTLDHKKKIVQLETVKSYLNSYFYYFNFKNENKLNKEPEN